MKLLFSFYALSAASSDPSGPRARPTCQDFKVEKNVDYPGNDIASFRVPPQSGQAECEQKCRVTVGCVGYSLTGRQALSQLSHTCFLKSSVEEKYARPGIISGTMSDLSEYEGNPFMVNNCKAILAERHCSFRASDCSFSDSSSSFYDDAGSSADCLFGYMKDSMGCVIDSCACNEEPQGEMHYGDIIVTEKMKNMMSAPEFLPDEVQRAADISVARWTQYRQGSVVYIPYRISYLGAAGQTAARAGMRLLEAGTCLRFRQRSNERDFMDFFVGGGCYSPVGRQGGAQRISLGNGCNYDYTAAHEIMHSLGFWHEQMRPDRDSYVQVNMHNVSPAMRYNFNKIPTSSWNSFGQAFDVNSVMQYNGYAFSQNGQPVLVDRSTGRPIGWNTKLTASDYAQINSLYGCGSYPTVAPTAGPTAGPTTTTRRTTTRATDRPSTCSDYTGYSGQCASWKAYGYCQTYSRTSMEYYCSRTCGFCSTGGGGLCTDGNRYCSDWAAIGECSKNPAYMHQSCRKACRLC